MGIRPVIIGNFGPPTLACIRSWGEKGCQVGFICIASEKAPIPKSKFLESVIILPPELRFKPEGIQIISNYLDEFDASGLIAISEEISYWLYENQDQLPPKNKLWINKSDALRKLLLKQDQIFMAKEAGFDVLPTYFIMNINDIETIDSDSYPLCLRPSDPFAIMPTFKVQYIAHKKQFIKFMCKIDKIEKPIVAQPFLVLPNLNIHASRSEKGELYGIQSFLVKRKFKGVSLTFEPYEINREYYKKCASLANKLDARGPFDIECLFDEKGGKIYFIELNNRFGGATAKAFACGYDEPYYALESYGVNCGTPRQMRKVVVTSRQAIIKCLVATLGEKLTPFDYPDESKFRRMLFLGKAFLTCYDDIFSFSDMKGSLSLYYTNIQNKIVGS